MSRYTREELRAMLGADHRDVTCPACGAAVGEHCHSPSGARRYKGHSDRRQDNYERIVREVRAAASGEGSDDGG